MNRQTKSVKKIPSVEDLNQLCRICLEANKKLVSMQYRVHFQEYYYPIESAETATLDRIMCYITDEENIYIGNGLPTQICQDCVELIKASFLFKVKYKISKELLNIRLQYDSERKNCDNKIPSETTVVVTQSEDYSQGSISSPQQSPFSGVNEVESDLLPFETSLLPYQDTFSVYNPPDSQPGPSTQEPVKSTKLEPSLLPFKTSLRSFQDAFTVYKPPDLQPGPNAKKPVISPTPVTKPLILPADPKFNKRITFLTESTTNYCAQKEPVLHPEVKFITKPLILPLDPKFNKRSNVLTVPAINCIQKELVQHPKPLITPPDTKFSKKTFLAEPGTNSSVQKELLLHPETNSIQKQPVSNLFSNTDSIKKIPIVLSLPIDQTNSLQKPPFATENTKSMQKLQIINPLPTDNTNPIQKPSDLHLCPVCLHEFSSTRLKEHVQIHYKLHKYIESVPKLPSTVRFYSRGRNFKPRGTPETHKCPVCQRNIQAWDFMRHISLHRGISKIEGLLMKVFKKKNKRYRKKATVECKPTEVPQVVSSEQDVTKHVLHLCPFCSIQLPVVEFRKHIQEHEILKENLAMAVKVKSTARFYTKNRKMAAQRPELQFHNCSFCKAKVTTSDFLEHLSFHETEGNYICTTCKKSFKSRNNLINHKRCHRKHSLFTYQCKTCLKKFISEKSYEDHLLEHGMTQESLYDKLPFKDYSRRDVSYSRKFFTRRRCMVCLGTFKEESDFKQHSCYVPPLKSAEQNYGQAFVEVIKKRTKMVLCSICGLYVNHLNQHIRRRHTARQKKNEKEAKTVCNEKKSSPRNLCFICGRYVTDFRTHLERHYAASGKESYTCPTCKKSFSTSSIVKLHQRIHAKNRKRSFLCSFCPKRFFDKKSVFAHEIIHRGDKCHICQICQKGFLTNASLLRHLRMHARNLKYNRKSKRRENVKDDVVKES